MSFNSIISDLTTKHFTSTNTFGEAVTLYPGGDNNYPTSETIYGVVDLDGELGTNEVTGDGRVLERKDGRRLRHSMVFECDVSEDIVDTRDPPDVIVYDSQRWALKRIMSRDAAMMSCLFVRTDTVHSRNTSNRG
jgi:hypothetical protein|tara:strand:+ start:437 stop:841 length:405 start_codon:yes stop_codon:yes gene_type:complete